LIIAIKQLTFLRKKLQGSCTQTCTSKLGALYGVPLNGERSLVGKLHNSSQ